MEEKNENLQPYDDAPGKSLMMRQLADDDKPREKALINGIDTLTDAELLAILLGTGIQGKSVLDFSREVLRDNGGSLARLSRRTIPELIRSYKGMGPAKATLLVAAMNFGLRCQKAFEVKDPQMASSHDVYNYMHPKLALVNYEEFWVLHLSRANRVMHAERVARGGISATVVDARLIAKSAIDHISSAIILVHNHPSGNLKPSMQDDAITRKIVDVARICDIVVQDHIIIGQSGYYSYRDSGKL
ncbi:MAG: DNA repair protein RadC [Muribaculaceae bacterium]